MEFNILCAFTGKGSHPLEVYRYLRDVVGAQFIQFIRIVERDNNSGYQEGYKVTRRSITGKKYGDFLIKVFDEWVQNDVGKVFVQIFDVALAVWYGNNAGLCIFEKTCGKALALEHNGDLYSCALRRTGVFSGNISRENLIGLGGSEKQVSFGQAKLDTLPQYCLDCESSLFVMEDAKNRIRKTQMVKPGLNYLCEGYKAFFSHRPVDARLSQLIRQNRAPRRSCFINIATWVYVSLAIRTRVIFYPMHCPRQIRTSMRLFGELRRIAAP